MGTYNGSKYLAQQLDSLATQSHENWRLIVSDDGSLDTTLRILNTYQEIWGVNKLVIRQGPKNGFAQNFLSMACDPSIKADYYAFCDQDDVWLPEKLQVSIDYLNSVDHPESPHVYCGRTAYVRDNLKPYTYSPEFVFPRTFGNALVQSIAGGNTMVFNQATKTLFEKTGLVPTPSHDWWLYQLVTAAAGVVYYDSKPYILYRQHANSLIGGNASLWARIKRMSMLIQGRFKTFSDQNIKCLRMCYAHITPAAREKTEFFAKMRDARLKDRLRLMEVCGLYRQTWWGTLSFVFAALFKKI
ncbi:MAG: glycosyltransferase family 2 protein [Betaproteobacteria bacterium]|nr:glycosyltransferase family 2 protein [Betaproteobacteria bacterium]